MKQPLQYYLNLFTSQYRMSTNLNAWQRALMTPIDDLSSCIQTFNTEYDLDYAIGVQLDTLGQIIGVNRKVGFQPTGGISPILDDPTYRLLLRATLANDFWDGKTSSIYAIWQYLFPGGTIVIKDNQDMTATISTIGTFSSIVTDLIKNGLIVPRPEGVWYDYAVGADAPLFGFDTQTSAIAGFDSGKWAK
jgi:hypothetical protein